MKSKRLLSLMLALCLVLTLLAPAGAFAATTADSTDSTANAGTADSKTPSKGTVISSPNAKGENAKTGTTLRDVLNNIQNLFTGDGEWTAEENKNASSVLEDNLPGCVEELRELAKTYAGTDMVPAFVVLEEAPLVDFYSDINDIPADVSKDSAMQQETAIATIEEEVLDGESLDVITQFTYLTNAIVVETEFQNLEQIAMVDGVETVFVSPVFYPCETLDSQATSSGEMTDVDDVWGLGETGYTGSGMTIAIMDTGLDLDHPAFAAAPSGAAWSQEHVAELLANLELNCEELYSGTLSADSLYYNAKVPFAFNYAMGTLNVGHSDGVGDHGTHVAGIAAANKQDGVGVVGMAPDAQIIVMKVFSSETGGANMYDLLKALEDCMMLDVDVANMSLGSAAGFTESGIAVIDEVFAKVSDTGLIMDIAAGNEGTSSIGSLWGNGMNTTENVDTSTISSPSTYAHAMSIASVDNRYVMTSYFTLADGTKIFFQPSVEYMYEYVHYSLEVLEDLGVVEYVVIDGLGEPEDFVDEDGNSIVSGKIAVVKRGDLTFGTKVANAANAGAVGVLIWDNVSEDIFSFGMSTSDNDGNYPTIPVVLISLEDGEKLAAADEKTITVTNDNTLRADAAGGQMSSFSCWGVTPDLRLLPDITGVGGNIYSCYDGGKYGLMSGTSMATPQVAGVTALVLQYLHEQFPSATDSEIRTLVDALMMSTATVVVDNDTDLPASPRQQGAGLVNALNAVTAEAYLSVQGSARPKAELFDSEDGTYSFTFTVHNFGDEAKTYTLSASLLCEDYATDDAYPGVYFMAQQEHALDASAVSFSENTVTVAAGATATVTVTIELTDSDKEWINTYFPSGNYVEGFVCLSSEDAVDLSLPFLGFYGQWDKAPVFDTGYWYDNGFWSSIYEDVNVDSVEANMYYHLLWTSLGLSEEDWILGLNPYMGAEVDENGDMVYDSKNNVLSPNGDGTLDQISNLYLSLMRNAAQIKLTYTDAEGNVLDEEILDKESKTMYNSNYGATVPFVYSWFYEDLYDFAGLEDGDVVYLTVSGVIDYEGAQWDSLEPIPIYIDTTAPVLDTENIVESSDDDGNNYLTLTFTDAHPAAVITMNTTGTQIYDHYGDQDMVDNGDGTWSVTVDVTGKGDVFAVTLADYGCNESQYTLTWSVAGGNDPEMDTSELYAYQVYNSTIYAYYGWDYMFGWTTIDKTTAEVEMISSDAYEYYALTAAEYVDGYVFAVDAGFNLLYMTPGVWSRNVICNLGVNVVDMAFDDTTGTMYLATSDDENYSYCLYTVDLLTGELTLVWDYYDETAMPWSMTFVDGELYCCKSQAAGFYKVDFDNYYQLTPVTLEDGSEFLPKVSGEDDVMPYYSQSMTYSETDGKIYWAYYGYGGSCLITIDPSTWTSTAAAMPADQEYVGLLMLEEDAYEIPASDAVTKMVISDEQLILGTDQTHQLSVTLLPWNAPVTQDVVWTTADESVATVDENGVVTTVTEGSTVICATYGDLYVECVVNVVDVSGHLNAYKFFDGNYDFGYWLDIDLGTVTEEATANSPIDFIAADYNGHKGLVYGYSEAGQCYWFDPETEEYGTLGTPNNTMVPADLAYDYSTGMMYAIVYDYMSWTTTLYVLNMNTGALIEQATVYDIFMTLACSTDGQLYGVNYYGELYELHLVEGAGGDMGGGGIMPWFDDGFGVDDGFGFDDGFGVDDSTTETTYYIETYWLAQLPVYELALVQTMCYDHNNDVLLWINPETSSVYWIGGLDSEAPFAVSLGDPSHTGLIQYTGAHVIPEEIPELPFVPVSSASADDLFMLVGQSKPASVAVMPLNASSYVIYNSFSMDENVAYYDEETGMVVAVGVGTTTIGLGVVDCGEDGVDDGITDPWYDVYFTVTVKEPTDNIYGYLMGDLGNGDGYYWMNISDTDPVNYMGLEYAYYDGMYLTIYAAEYVDGTIYAYGYNADDWNANFLFLTIDPRTWSITSATDMGDAFPFVYDMAFDYTTGTMYALAGPSDNSTDLYYVNLQSGKLVDAMATGSDYMFLSMAIDDEGTIYAMACSLSEMDWETWATTIYSAQMYTLDPETGAIEWFMDSGVTCDMLSTMAYDYDTGYIYWNAIDSNYTSALYLIDTDDQAAYQLGPVGNAGSQVTGLMIIADEYPEVPTDLKNVTFTADYLEMTAGNTVETEILLQPGTVDVNIAYGSSDESVATVDENGVVTAVSAGTATITVTATDAEGNVRTATCTVLVYGADDYFITYNVTDGGFSKISRPDSTIVTNFTEAEEAPAVVAMAMINGIIYAYDEEGNFFKTTVDNDFVRTQIGHCGVEVGEPYETHESYPYNGATTIYDNYYTPGFDIRDMVYDEVNDRLLVLACHVEEYVMYYGYESESYSTYYEFDSGVFELEGDCKIYEVDLTTGELEEVCVVGGEYYESGVTMFTVVGDKAYTYSYAHDYVMEMDLQTGEVTYTTSFQNQGVYGSSNGDPMAMVYDENTNALYMLFTENGRNYSLYSFDLTNKMITLIDYVGEVEYIDWAYRGDSFAGLVLNEAHVHHYEEVTVDPTCTEDGSVTYTCHECGHSYSEVIEATGHSYDAVVTDPTAKEDGYTTHTCEHCGDTYVDSFTPALGDNTDDPTDPTDPDDSTTDTDVPTDPDGSTNTGDTFSGMWFFVLMISVAALAVLLVNRKKLLVA